MSTAWQEMRIPNLWSDFQHRFYMTVEMPVAGREGGILGGSIVVLFMLYLGKLYCSCCISEKG